MGLTSWFYCCGITAAGELLFYNNASKGDMFMPWHIMLLVYIELSLFKMGKSHCSKYVFKRRKSIAFFFTYLQTRKTWKDPKYAETAKIIFFVIIKNLRWMLIVISHFSFGFINWNRVSFHFVIPTYLSICFCRKQVLVSFCCFPITEKVWRLKVFNWISYPNY